VDSLDGGVDGRRDNLIADPLFPPTPGPPMLNRALVWPVIGLAS
jgi:hypothetical protein